jgi:hypothetical protein
MTIQSQIERKGMVRAVETYFEYSDGTPYYPFGTTVYALLYQPEVCVKETLDSLKKSPFNKVRFCIFQSSMIGIERNRLFFNSLLCLLITTWFIKIL